jgi:hypothetical protein
MALSTHDIGGNGRRFRDGQSRCDLTARIGRTAALCLLGAFAAAGCADDAVSLAEGRHTLVRLVREGGDRAYLLSIRDPQPDGGILQITPLDRPDAHCEVGWVGGELSVVAQTRGGNDPGDDVIDIHDGAAVQVITWGRDAGVRVGDLMHIDMQCQRRDPSLTDVVDLLQMDGGAWLATTATGELWRLVPEAGERQLLATNVVALEAGLRSGRTDDFTMVWTIEGGEVVAREATGDVLQRFGEGATDLTAVTSTAYFTNHDGVHKQSGLEPAPVLIEAGGCRPAPATGLVYSLAPCEERRLVARDPGTGEQWAFGDDVSLPLVVGPGFDGRPLAVFATGPERDDLAHLWGRALTARIQPPLETVWFAASPDEQHMVGHDISYIAMAALRREGIEWAVLHEPVPNQGTLLRWSASEGARELADGVAWLRGSWIVHQFDGSVGELARFEDGGPTLEVKAAGVLPESVRFVHFPGMHLAYLRDADPDTGSGTLEVQALVPHTAPPKHVRDNVRQFLGLSAPQPGFVLAVVADDGSEQVIFQHGHPRTSN